MQRFLSLNIFLDQNASATCGCVANKMKKSLLSAAHHQHIGPEGKVGQETGRERYTSDRLTTHHFQLSVVSLFDNLFTIRFFCERNLSTKKLQYFLYFSKFKLLFGGNIIFQNSFIT